MNEQIVMIGDDEWVVVLTMPDESTVLFSRGKGDALLVAPPVLWDDFEAVYYTHREDCREVVHHAAQRFAAAIAELQAAPAPEGVHPSLRAAEIAGLQSVLIELLTETAQSRQ